MAEATRWEAERSAWIKSRRWLDRHSAARRADRLARRARQLEREKTGLDESSMHESETKGAFHRWTHHDEAKTSGLGFFAYVIVFCVVGPVLFGLAWLVSVTSYRAWEMVGDRARVRIWPYFAAAAIVAVALMFARPTGADLPLIYALASFIEGATGGLIAPEALSRWYAAGWVSWLEIQLVIGLAGGGYLAYAWGWAAPSIRRGEREQAQSRSGRSDKSVRIISDRPATRSEGVPTKQQATNTNDTAHDPLKIISGQKKEQADV